MTATTASAASPTRTTDPVWGPSGGGGLRGGRRAGWPGARFRLRPAVSPVIVSWHTPTLRKPRNCFSDIVFEARPVVVPQISAQCGYADRRGPLSRQSDSAIGAARSGARALGHLGSTPAHQRAAHQRAAQPVAVRAALPGRGDLALALSGVAELTGGTGRVSRAVLAGSAASPLSLVASARVSCVASARARFTDLNSTDDTDSAPQRRRQEDRGCGVPGSPRSTLTSDG